MLLGFRTKVIIVIRNKVEQMKQRIYDQINSSNDNFQTCPAHSLSNRQNVCKFMWAVFVMLIYLQLIKKSLRDAKNSLNTTISTDSCQFCCKKLAHKHLCLLKHVAEPFLLRHSWKVYQTERADDMDRQLFITMHILSDGCHRQTSSFFISFFLLFSLLHFFFLFINIFFSSISSSSFSSYSSSSS